MTDTPDNYIQVKVATAQAFTNAMLYLTPREAASCHAIPEDDGSYTIFGPPELASKLEADHPAARPTVPDITPAQGMIQLSRMPAAHPDKFDNLLEEVEDSVNKSTDTELKIWWSRALTWKRTSPSIGKVAEAFNLSDEQVDNAFQAAAGITE